MSLALGPSSLSRWGDPCTIRPERMENREVEQVWSRTARVPSGKTALEKLL